MTNRNGFRPYDYGYLRCTKCAIWVEKDKVVEFDAQGSPLCPNPRCHRRLRSKSRGSRKRARDVESKLLPCPFSSEVKCSFIKSQGSISYGRCERCGEYRRFMAEMAAEDEKMMDEIDEIQRTGVWK